MKPAPSALPSGIQVVRLSADCLAACLQRQAGRQQFCQPRVCQAIGQLLPDAEIHAARQEEGLTFHVAHSSLPTPMILAVRFDETAERQPDSIEILQLRGHEDPGQDDFTLRLFHRLAMMGAALGFRTLFYRGAALSDTARAWGFVAATGASGSAALDGGPRLAEALAGARTPAADAGPALRMEFELQPQSLSWVLLDQELARITPAR